MKEQQTQQPPDSPKLCEHEFAPNMYSQTLPPETDSVSLDIGLYFI